MDAPEGKTLHQTARQPLFGLRYFRVPNKITSLCMYGILSIYLLYIYHNLPSKVHHSSRSWIHDGIYFTGVERYRRFPQSTVTDIF